MFSFAASHMLTLRPTRICRSVETWGFRFALTCVAEVAAKTLTAEAPAYETIMELDRKVREFPIPPDAAALQEDLEGPSDSEPPSLQDSMIRFVLSHSREVSEYSSLHSATLRNAAG